MKLQLRLWEWAVILVLVFIGAALLMAALPRAREASRHASCASNLKQLGMVMKMFANESKGATFPPLSPIPNNWMFDMSALYPEYLTDLSVLVCPSSLIHLRFERPECVSSLYYIRGICAPNRRTGPSAVRGIPLSALRGLRPK